MAALAALLLVPSGSGSRATPPLPGRFLLAYVSSGHESLAQSSDGVRWSPVAGFAASAGTAPTAIRRGQRLYVYDGFRVTDAGIEGSLRRLLVGAAGLSERPDATFEIELSSLEDAERASAITGSVVRDADGTLVAVYALRYEPGANACPVRGQACVKIRTATEQTGSDGGTFVGDEGNRAVVGFAQGASVSDPTVVAAANGFVVLLAGPGDCLHELLASDLHGPYRPPKGISGGCLARFRVATPSGLYRKPLAEYWLYGVEDGALVRGVARRLDAVVPPTRLRPLTGLGGGAITSARVSPNTP